MSIPEVLKKLANAVNKQHKDYSGDEATRLAKLAWKLYDEIKDN